MNENAKQSIQLQINELKNLPALPEVSVRILEAINDPEISIDKLTDVLSLSPALVARLLGLSNSAFFAQPRPIDNLRSAIFQVLGLDLVKSLSLGIVLHVQFDSKKCQSFSTEYFWVRSLIIAVAAQKLAAQNNLQSLPLTTVYTSGLLLNIGVLVMAYLFPEQLNSALLLARTERVAVGEQIIRQFGQSHYQIGYVLLKKWHLSSVYQAVLQHFDDLDFAGGEAQLIRLLKASQWLCSMLLNEQTPDAVELEQAGACFAVTADSLLEVFQELLENQQDIQKLALIMGH